MCTSVVRRSSSIDAMPSLPMDTKDLISHDRGEVDVPAVSARETTAGATPTSEFNFPDLIRDRARERGGQTAISDDQRSFTYAELNSNSNRVAQGLLAAGTDKGDRVIHLGRNRLEFFDLIFGCAKAGAVLTPLNWRLTPDDIAALIADARATVVFVDEEFVDRVPDIYTKVVIEDSYSSWLAQQPDIDTGYSSGPEDVVVQSYTSGTTSLPKGVLLTNSNYEYALRNHQYIDMDESMITLAAMPMYHVGGSVWVLFASYVGGRAVVMNIESFDPRELAGVIERERITHLNLAPVMITMLADLLAKEPFDISSIKVLVYGGQAITEKALIRVNRHVKVPLMQMYGMTETTGAGTRLLVEDHHGQRLRSAGRAVPGIEIAVFDVITNAQVPPNTTGEVRFRAGVCSPGYWKRSDATDELYVDGWLRSGDVGHLDEDGFLYLTDRAKDMIITGGENVYPAEVETVLLEHDDVDEVAVVGVPHDKWGEAVTAFVVLTAGSTLTDADLAAWARTRIAGFRRPQNIYLIDNLPRNAAGKLLRRQLREPYWAGERAIG
jgi:long-chain acyl-CoA synthetase